MEQQRKSFMRKGAAALLLLVVPSALATAPCGNNFDTSNSQTGYIMNGRTPDANGAVHITYTTDTGVINPAMSAAFSAWNQFSGTTHIVWDQATGSSADVQIRYQANAGCISALPSYGNNTITYGSDFAPILRATNLPPKTDAIKSFEHEIGHLMNLNDNPVGSGQGIMDQSTGCIPGNQGYSWDAAAPTQADASSVNNCITLAELLCSKCKRH